MEDGSRPDSAISVDRHSRMQLTHRPDLATRPYYRSGPNDRLRADMRAGFDNDAGIDTRGCVHHGIFVNDRGGMNPDRFWYLNPVKKELSHVREARVGVFGNPETATAPSGFDNLGFIYQNRGGLCRGQSLSVARVG